MPKTARNIPIVPEPGAKLSAPHRRAVMDVLNALRHEPGALLPILHGVQDALGYIPTDAVPLIAHELNLTRAEVHGVISFYHYFRQQPPGQRVIYICRAEACQAVGARELEAHVQQTLGLDYHQTSADGRYSLEPVYCLGNCACGPSIMINQQLHARVTPPRFDRLLHDDGGQG